jgi:hypothetical protein
LLYDASMADSDAPTTVDAYGIAWQPLREYFFDLLAVALVWGSSPFRRSRCDSGTATAPPSSTT